MAEGKGHTELLPCPFCGGRADFECIGGDKFATWSVGCMNSEIDCIGYQMLAHFNRKCEAAQAWNTRAAVNTYPAVEGLVKALEDWLYYAEENLSEFDYEDCHAEKLCHQCESSGCINLKIRNARSALSRFRSLQNGGAE